MGNRQSPPCVQTGRMRAERGFTLMELTIALVLSTLVLALVGSLFVASLSAWRLGSDLREAQVQANTLVDVMARDIRSASQAPSVTIRPQFAVDEGETILSISSTGANRTAAGTDAAGAGDGPVWILYLQRPAHHDVVRQIVVPGPGGRVTPRDTRIVALGVEKVTVEPAGNGVLIEVEVRRGREVASSRVTAAPRNP
jgi:prepilin-type N-terminal cleavage/methylation domain-containing protein